jgi:hypothetical protein
MRWSLSGTVRFSRFSGQKQSGSRAAWTIPRDKEQDMRSATASGSAVTDTTRGAMTHLENGMSVVAGVKWLGGTPAADRSRRDAMPAAQPERATFVIGRAHGPRLLELLCAAG